MSLGPGATVGSLLIHSSELLEGNTMREAMNGAALSVRKARDYALQIAHGLSAAHGKGAIHPDLKPENIFVTKDGRVKILDFGLAKLRSADAHIRAKGTPGGELADVGIRAPDVEASTVVQSAVESTEPGMVLGTAAYMSPEQVRGEPADHRADLFAFGCVLYEMLSGVRAFRRNTTVESMNAVLSEEPPDLTASNANIPPALERVTYQLNSQDEPASDSRPGIAADRPRVIHRLRHPSDSRHT